MTFEQAFERLERLERELPQRFADAARVAALDLVAAVVDRVVETGHSASGNQFTPYSTLPMQAWRLWGKSTTQAAEKKVRALAREDKTISYAEFRRLNGRPDKFKNFSFTNAMWRDFGVISINLDGTSIEVRIGGKTEQSRRKINENSEREGVNIVEPSADEINAFKTAVLKNALNNV